VSSTGKECQEHYGGKKKLKAKANFNYFILSTTQSREPKMLSITFYSKDKQRIGYVDYTVDFAYWLLDRGLYRIDGVSASESLVLEEDDEEERYEIEAVLLTSAARKKLLRFFEAAIIQESSKPSWKIGLLRSLNELVENEDCLYMDYFE
jgi:hypothetical protein